MDIQLKVNDDQGRFYIEEEGRLIAELDFKVDDGILDAYHTGVRPEFEGQGIASRLFDEMVKYAREHDYTVLPRALTYWLNFAGTRKDSTMYGTKKDKKNPPGSNALSSE